MTTKVGWILKDTMSKVDGAGIGRRDVRQRQPPVSQDIEENVHGLAVGHVSRRVVGRTNTSDDFTLGLDHLAPPSTQMQTPGIERSARARMQALINI